VDNKNQQISEVDQVTQVVKSPCVNICCLDDEDICLGCYRSCEEICKWGAMSIEQRKDTMKKVATREQNSGNVMKF